MDQPIAQAVISPALSQEACPKCKTPITPIDNFCPHCGLQITRHVGVWKQVWIYFVSLAFPPLGLTWTFKYVRSQYKQVKYVGIAAAVLTIIATVVTIWFTMGFLNIVNQQVNQQLGGNSLFNNY